MEQGLAHTMVYGDGSNNSVKHYYSGTIKDKKAKRKCKVKNGK